MMPTPQSSTERVTTSKTSLTMGSQGKQSIDEKAVLRKIDIHIIPWLAFLYLLSFLDRGSIGNAKASARIFAISLVHSYHIDPSSQLYNLERDIHITDHQYLIALTVFFFPYALFEVLTFFRTQ